MTERRSFLTALGAAGVLGAWRPARGALTAPTVEAVPTLLHAHPDGQTTLTRFVATGTDAVAGRLRVTDARTGRLLGTAGMIRRGDVLLGELRLPLTTRLAVWSAFPQSRSRW